MDTVQVWDTAPMANAASKTWDFTVVESLETAAPTMEVSVISMI
jgi:hypothetical protein